MRPGLCGATAFDLRSDQVRRELCLTSGADHEHDELTCDRECGVTAEISPHHSERQVDAGRNSSRPPDLAVLHVHGILFHTHAGVTHAEFSYVTPMSGGTASVEQSGVRQNERTGAN